MNLIDRKLISPAALSLVVLFAALLIGRETLALAQNANPTAVPDRAGFAAVTHVHARAD